MNLKALHELGQSIWLDYIRRHLVRSGQLAMLIDQGLRGVTSNPSIFEKSIAGSTDYSDAIAHMADHGRKCERSLRFAIRSPPRGGPRWRRAGTATEPLLRHRTPLRTFALRRGCRAR